MSRLAPFSLRLTPEERSQLEAQAGAMPLSSYIKSVVFAAEAPKYRRRRKQPVAEQQFLAEILARLGQTRQASNLNQIAKHLNQGTLIVDEELPSCCSPDRYQRQNLTAKRCQDRSYNQLHQLR